MWCELNLGTPRLVPSRYDSEDTTLEELLELIRFTHRKQGPQVTPRTRCRAVTAPAPSAPSANDPGLC